MFGLFTPILLLQAFCTYHAYRNNAEQRWYWLILFFPLIGCIIYLVHNFNNRATLSTLTETVKEVVISNYRVEQLEKALRFSDTVKNKMNLAEAYMELGRYADAVALYTSCLQGFMADDLTLRMNALFAHFMNADYQAVISYGSSLESEKSFKNSQERVAYAWSFYHTGKTDLAERIFVSMDNSFANYFHRMEYSKFLLKTGKIEDAKVKLTELVEEFEHMKGTERRLEKSTFREIKELYASHVRA
jgi:hypothetical protein